MVGTLILAKNKPYILQSVRT